jgi:predicted HD superfamily hydrolase involved in NAD metabolism
MLLFYNPRDGGDRVIEDALLEAAGEYARRRLSDERYAHTVRVTETAERLANLHGISPRRARLAALLHDSARELPPEELLRLAGKRDLPVGEPERERPVLLHGPVAAGLAREEFGIEDGEILEAIGVHTTGQPGMSPLALAVYVADKVEPGRDYPSVKRLRDLAGKDLHEAAKEALERSCAHNERRGRPAHPASLETLRWLESGQRA